MNLKVDLSKDGLEMFFFDYQIEALRVLWDTEGDLSSRDVWEAVNNRVGKISRASIINFLNDMIDYGILLGYETTGKGGMRTIYSPAMDEVKLKQLLHKQVTTKIDELMV